MRALLNRLPKLTERNWLIILLIVFNGFIYYISNTAGMFFLFGLALPVSTYHAIENIRSRELRRNKVFRLKLFSAVWCLFSVFVTMSASAEWALGMWMIFSCWFFVLFIPENMDEEGQHRELFSVGMSIICFYFPFSLAAMISVFTGRIIRFPMVDMPVGIQAVNDISSRIFIFTHPNTVARFASFIILFAIYGIITHKNKYLRAFLVVNIVLSVMVLAHTQSRTGHIALAAALAIIAFRGLWLKVSSRIWRIAAAVAAAVFVLCITLAGINSIYKMDVKIARNIVFENASNEKITTRAEEVGQFDLFSTNRDDIWISTLSYLKDNPKYLITGMGGGDNYERIRAFYPEAEPYTAYHNTFLACVADYGVPLLAAMLVFLCMLVVPSLRMLLEPTTEKNRGMFIVPVFVAFFVLNTMTEETIFITKSYPNTLFYFFCGHVLHYNKINRFRKI